MLGAALPKDPRLGQRCGREAYLSGLVLLDSNQMQQFGSETLDGGSTDIAKALETYVLVNSRFCQMLKKHSKDEIVSMDHQAYEVIRCID